MRRKTPTKRNSDSLENKSSSGHLAEKIQTNKKLSPLAWIIVFALIAVAFVWSRMEVVKTSYEISKLKKGHKKLSLKNDYLKVKHTRLSHPKRLEKIGIEQFEMSVPKKHQIWQITLGSTDVVNQAQSGNKRKELP